MKKQKILLKKIIIAFVFVMIISLLLISYASTSIYQSIRCRVLGGEIREETTFVGYAASITKACYPIGSATDAGTICTNDNDCEGECIWLSGDFISPDDHYECSGYKKPIFVYQP